MPRASRCRTASVIPLENGIQVKGTGMDPGFHRGDDNAEKTEGDSRLPANIVEIPQLRAEGCSVHRRTVVVFAAGEDLEAFLQSIETAAFEIVNEAQPGIAGAKIKIPKDHATEMGQVGDAALA